MKQFNWQQKTKLDRSKITLALLANVDQLNTTQIQKLLFVLDREVPRNIGGPFFKFIPNSYGPWSPQIYTTLTKLEKQYLINNNLGKAREQCYSLTNVGQKKGNNILKHMDKRTTDYIQTLIKWAKNITSRDLIKAINNQYPDMAVNSLFQPYRRNKVQQISLPQTK